MEKTLSMNLPKIQVRETRTHHRNIDILARETDLFLFKGKEDLKYCRETYRDGVGTRKFAKLVEQNFGFDERYEVLGYTTDASKKVLRVFVNKYSHPDGDDVCESILWPPVIGKPSTYKYNQSREFYYS
mgnify:CR=1 FL=1|tara:strand:+ start:761 stop:1147 length:387 start_codon:yes stop_codon:yes gene_type:complete